MDASESFNVFFGLCAVALVIGLVVGVLAYLTTSTARNERGRPRHQGTPPLAPPSLGQSRQPETLPPPWPDGQQSLLPNNDARIRFGENQAFTPPSSNRLKWKDEQLKRRTPPPQAEDGQQKCPVCRSSPPREEDGVKCNQCDTIYHTDCWEVLNQSCRICEQTAS